MKQSWKSYMDLVTQTLSLSLTPCLDSCRSVRGVVCPVSSSSSSSSSLYT